ncbi:MAG TPA: helix-turn-helix domain-containing protein [Methylomirabilota bacterium]|nr:helix-turn-helix domain-containing protein [Methylomirabilota bacterium]
MDPGYGPRAGATFRALIEDLRRDEETAAAKLGLEVVSLREMLAGERPIPPEILRRAVRRLPVNRRDLPPLHDDCPDGVRLMRRSESAASRRVVRRRGRDCYEYRDTATSRLCAFRPEWIRMLQVVDGEDPDDPRVAWDRGQLLHQFTYIVGDINYYFEWAGRRSCAAMRAGDSVWARPFAPHGFAARGSDRPSFILALTYGVGLVGDVQHELAALGVDAARRYALPVADGAAAGAALLRMHAGDAGLTAGALARLAELPAARIQSLLDGATQPANGEVEWLAEALGVHARELLPPIMDLTEGVRIQRAGESPRWGYPDEREPHYRLSRLAGSRLHPSTRALEVEVRAACGGEAASLETGLHQYVYCLGPGPVRFGWSVDGRGFEDVMETGDSAYVKPFVPHRWWRPSPARAAWLLVLRVPGKVRADAMTELGAMPAEAMARAVAEARHLSDTAASQARAAAGES